MADELASQGPLTPAAQPLATPKAAPDYYSLVAQRESSGKADVVNPASGATGLFQFLPSTWETLRHSHPELGLQPGGAADPAQATKAMQAFTADNARHLASEGIAVTDRNLYMAHFLGAAGAAKFIKAGAQDPNTPAAAAFPAEARANPTVFYGAEGQPRSLAQVYGMMTSHFGEGATATGVQGAQGLQMLASGGSGGVQLPAPRPYTPMAANPSAPETPEEKPATPQPQPAAPEPAPVTLNVAAPQPLTPLSIKDHYLDLLKRAPAGAARA